MLGVAVDGMVEVVDEGVISRALRFETIIAVRDLADYGTVYRNARWELELRDLLCSGESLSCVISVAVPGF